MNQETVVLVHGLWLSGFSMALVGRRLRACGFVVHTFSYPTVESDFRENAAALQAFLARFSSTQTVHLVGYSLGGLIVRALFHYYPEQRPGRIVNLGTPHAGSEAAKRLARFRFGQAMLGRSIGELLRQVPDKWEAPQREIGIIAGNLPLGLGRVFPDLPRPNDGTVCVNETRWKGAQAHVVLHVSHLGMLVSKHTAQQVCAFLRSGRFDR